MQYTLINTEGETISNIDLPHMYIPQTGEYILCNNQYYIITKVIHSYRGITLEVKHDNLYHN